MISRSPLPQAMVCLDSPQRARSPTRRSARARDHRSLSPRETRSEASVSRRSASRPAIDSWRAVISASNQAAERRRVPGLQLLPRDGTVHHVLPGRNWAWPANAREFIGSRRWQGRERKRGDGRRRGLGRAAVRVTPAVRGGCRKLPRRPAQTPCRDQRCRGSRRGRRHPARDHAGAAAGIPAALGRPALVSTRRRPGPRRSDVEAPFDQAPERLLGMLPGRNASRYY